jgi:DNA-binding IclR family transcriptional regulator
MALTQIGKERTSGVQVIARAADIMRALAEADEGMSLSALAVAVGLPRSTAHRIVSALEAESFVVWDSQLGVVRLGLGLVPHTQGRRRRLRDTVRPYLESLSRRIDETVDLAVLRGDTVLFIDQVTAPQRLLLVSAIGAILPAHCTACGKALLATLPEGEVTHLLPQKLQRYTAATVIDRSTLLEELKVIQVSRVAFDHNEHTDGISAVGAVVRNAWGEVASVTAPIPTQRFEGREEELAVALLEMCDELDSAMMQA